MSELLFSLIESFPSLPIKKFDLNIISLSTKPSFKNKPNIAAPPSTSKFETPMEAIFFRMNFNLKSSNFI